MKAAVSLEDEGSSEEATPTQMPMVTWGEIKFSSQFN